MAKTGIELGQIADPDNLARAAYLAARGKRARPEVGAFLADLEGNLARLAEGIRSATRPLGLYRAFAVRDPKSRLIHAPCFEDRVLHHALFAHAGPVLERALVDSCFACRPGKGPLAAVRHVQGALRRFPWYVKIDIRGYFGSIDQARLLDLLARRFKGQPLLDLLARILATYRTAPGKGLPIGTLSSQYFANYYLDGLDRLLLEQLKVRSHARYMDDLIWWCDDRARAKETLAQARDFARDTCLVEVKAGALINRSAHGVGFLGYRVLPGTLRLSHRRRQSFQERRRYWEREYAQGRLDALGLQRAYAAVQSIAAHADSRGWRAKNLVRFPPPDA